MLQGFVVSYRYILNCQEYCQVYASDIAESESNSAMI